jgi:hypothetical protein
VRSLACAASSAASLAASLARRACSACAAACAACSRSVPPSCRQRCERGVALVVSVHWEGRSDCTCSAAMEASR